MNYPRPTDGELQILQVLWNQGPSTVKEVNEFLSEDREVGYTTTLKIMQIMHDKGLVKREKSGKQHLYRPSVSEEATQNVLMDRFLETAFGTSPGEPDIF